jgi:peroxiredoxin
MLRPFFRPLAAFAVLISMTTAVVSAADAAPNGPNLLGRAIDDFTLQDFRGKAHSLSDFQDAKAVVVYFLGTECPLAKLYGPRIQELANRYREQGVVVLGINSNVQDSLAELAAHARNERLEYPIVKDPGNKIADRFGATRTPQVFLLDAKRKIRYYGRIDAQFTFGSGVGLAQPQSQRADLAEAIDELLAGKDISVPMTEAKGCLIGRSRPAAAASPVTYTNQISRLIQQRCLECHREGQIAPFAMSDYEQVAGWGEMMAEVVREQRMPPWHANPAHGKFANENLLTAEEKQLVYTWVENGCPEGDPADLPPPRQFHDQWHMSREPDRIVYMSEEPVSVKAEGVEPYRHYTVDPGITEDKWVKLAECMPGNRAVVHHIIVYARPPGTEGGEERSSGDGVDPRRLIFLAGFAPGTRPLVSPPGWAKKIPAGSKFVFEMHYTPIGTPQTDRSSIGLVFVDEKEVTHQLVTTNVMEHQFAIPPHDANYKVAASKTLRRDTTVLSLFPHMHMRGKSFRYELVRPDAKDQSEILLDVPNYDFNWQNSYVFAEPLVIPAGSELRCTAYYDNSDSNLANPDPSKTIRWGPQTWEEMMIGWYDIGIPIAETRGARETSGSE